MKLVLTADNRLGALRDSGMVDISSVFDDIRYRTAGDRMPRVVAELENRRSRIEALFVQGEPEPLPPLQAPLPRPPKLIAASGNFREGGNGERKLQDMFLQSPDSVIGPGGTVILPNHDATIFEHEAELAVVIGKRSKDLPADERALEAVAGYTCAMDIAGHGLGRVGPSRIGKSFDTFTPLGPALVTTDEVPDPQDLRITLTVSGEVRQESTTRDMEYSIVELLAFASSYMTLVPGDVVMCGTQYLGLGALQHGDQAEMTIERVGTLAVSVSDVLRREWPRGMDQDVSALQRAARIS